MVEGDERPSGNSGKGNFGSSSPEGEGTGVTIRDIPMAPVVEFI